MDGKRGLQHFKIARGSMLEVISAYETADRRGEEHPLSRIRREGHGIASMLTKLIRR